MGRGGRCRRTPDREVYTIAVVGKYVDHKDAYKSVGEALKHGGNHASAPGQPGLARSGRRGARGRRGAAGRGGRDPGPGRLRRPRLRGQGADLEVRP